MEQNQLTVDGNSNVRYEELKRLMALANEIARYASTNEQGKFERSRSWQ